MQKPQQEVHESIPNPSAWQRGIGVVSIEELPDKIQSLLDEREAARIARNWEIADAIRDKLRIEGYELEDTAHDPIVTKE